MLPAVSLIKAPFGTFIRLSALFNCCKGSVDAFENMKHVQAAVLFAIPRVNSAFCFLTTPKFLVCTSTRIYSVSFYICVFLIIAGMGFSLFNATVRGFHYLFSP